MVASLRVAMLISFHPWFCINIRIIIWFLFLKQFYLHSLLFLYEIWDVLLLLCFETNYESLIKKNDMVFWLDNLVDIFSFVNFWYRFLILHKWMIINIWLINWYIYIISNAIRISYLNIFFIRHSIIFLSLLKRIIL